VIGLRRGPDGHRRAGSILHGVGEKVVQHLGNPGGVDLDDRELVGHFQGEIQVRVDRSDPHRCVPDDACQPGGLARHSQPPALEPGGIQKVVDQLSKAIGFVVDDAEEFGPLRVVPLLVFAQQGRHIPLDKSERGAQLVRDGGDEFILHAGQLPLRLQARDPACHAPVLQQLPHMIGDELAEADLLGRIGRPSKPAENKPAHASPTHHHRQPQIVAPALATLHRGPLILVPQNRFPRSEGLHGGRLAPRHLRLLGAPSAEGAGIGGLQRACLLVFEIQGGDIEDEDRARQPEDRLQPRFGVERLGHDAGNGVDCVELGAVGELAGRRQGTGHRSSPAVSNVKLTSVPAPSWLSTWIVEPWASSTSFTSASPSPVPP